jgi:glycosyltransferase involved in cell wall biosynthesis
MTGGPRRSEVLVLAPQFPPAYLGGGPARTMEAMVRTCKSPELISVLSVDTDHGQEWPMSVTPNEWNAWNGAKVWYASARGAGLIRGLAAGRRERPRVVYLNSVFHLTFALLPLLLRKVRFWRGAEFVIAPRGEADPGALGVSRRKKCMFLRAAIRLGLYDNVWWHASSSLEAQHIRQLGLPSARILIKPNESLLPANSTNPQRVPHARARLLYLGRVSRKKRLERLLRALSHVRGDFSLCIAGTVDSASYSGELRQLAAVLGDRVTWYGAATRDEVFALLDQSDACCFPTAGENFGHVIAESLSRSCPVFIEDVTPWSEVIRGGGGQLVIPATESEWARRLQAFIDSPETWGPARARAGLAYDNWRDSTDQVSFLDYLVRGTHERLLQGSAGC